jgi:hypothetical protein
VLKVQYLLSRVGGWEDIQGCLQTLREDAGPKEASQSDSGLRNTHLHSLAHVPCL